MHIKIIAVLLYAVLLSGCLPTTPQELRQSGGSSYAFKSELSISEVASVLDNRFEYCYTNDLTGDGGQVDITSPTDQRSLKYYSLFVREMGSPLYLIDVRLEDINQKQTGVTVSYYSPWQSSANAVQRWINEDYLECSSHKKDDNGESVLDTFDEAVIDVGMEAKSAFEFLAHGMRSCHDANLVGGYGHINSIFEDNINEGVITFRQGGGMFSPAYKMRIIVKQSSLNQSEVKVLYNSGSSKYKNAVKSWLLSNGNQCSLEL